MTTTRQDTDNTKRPPPFSLRLTSEERQQLERRAAGTSLGAYIRACLFGENEANPTFKHRTLSKFPVKDHKALAHVLSQLGASRLASNLNQLAKAVNTGSLPVSPETERDLHTWVAGVVNQQVGQANVNGTKLRQLGVPVMPKEEQDKLHRLVENAFAWIDRLAADATSARKLIDNLDQAILAKAFRGELVLQDPDDEPASALL